MLLYQLIFHTYSLCNLCDLACFIIFLVFLISLLRLLRNNVKLHLEAIADNRSRSHIAWL